jgi:hypothetical protein
MGLISFTWFLVKNKGLSDFFLTEQVGIKDLHKLRGFYIRQASQAPPECSFRTALLLFEMLK